MVTTVVAPVAFDSTKLGETHTVWIQASRQWDLTNTTNPQTFKAVDQEFNFIPNGTGTRSSVRSSPRPTATSATTASSGTSTPTSPSPP